MDKKLSQTAASKQRPKQERRWIRKRSKGSQCTLESMVATEQHKMRSDLKVCFVLGSSRFPRGRQQKAALKIKRKKAAGLSEEKHERQVRLKGRERDYGMGTEIGIISARRPWVSGSSDGR